jgi:hypothetical protein
VNITELRAAIDAAFARNIDPETTVVFSTDEWYALVDDINDPTVTDDVIWFTLNPGGEPDSRFTPGHATVEPGVAEETVHAIIQAFADGQGPNGWDVGIMSAIEQVLREHGFVDSTTPGFRDPNEVCWPGAHIGPLALVPGSGDPLDHGIGLAIRCEACNGVGGGSLDLDDIDWMEGA